ncbi:hypothetical protein GOODEAATRI_030730 [Goodea atripinnis]|uniref:Uncharacterized protein n=1 Tax=Goodea atripinnis TaxID=208336 RepID=A0ABV0MY12_9TELE
MLAEKGREIAECRCDFNSILNKMLDKRPKNVEPKLKTAKYDRRIRPGGNMDTLHPKERDFTFLSQVHGTYSKIEIFAISKKEYFQAVKNSLKIESQIMHQLLFLVCV